MSELPDKRIDENAIKAWKITAAIWSAFLFVIPGGLYAIYEFGDLPVIYPIIAGPVSVLLYTIIVFVLPKFRWKRWYYDVDEQAVDMLRGIIFRKRTLVPVNRIQHVDTKQGPIYRKFGLSSINISTAATTHEIPALDEETATQLRNNISELVRRVKEDV
jgi:hypothetical protein